MTPRSVRLRAVSFPHTLPLGLVLAVALSVACVPPPSNSAQPRNAVVGGGGSPDASPPTPKPSTKSGVIVPSDTGIGAGPPGSSSTSSTGTSGKSAGPLQGK